MESNPEHSTGIKGIILDLLSWTRVAIVESAEVVASYQAGQFLIKYTDKALWLIEKSSQWSLPPPTKNEEKPLVMSELSRPLPWVFFLPTLLILRLFRETVSIGMFFLGSRPLKPSQMVRVIQNWRRSLRAIKYHGIRNIRMQNQKKASKPEEDDRGFSDWIYSKIQGLLCYKVVRYSNGKQPKAIQDRRNSGEEIVVCKQIAKNKKRPLSSDDDDDDIDETYDADSVLRELASKVDLLPESDSEDTEYSLVNISNNLDTSCTSTDDDDDDNDDKPEDQQVHEESSKNPEDSVQREIQPGTSGMLDRTSETSVQSKKKHDASVNKRSAQSSGIENQMETTAQSESKQLDSSTQLGTSNSSVQLENERDTSETVSDEAAKTENQPTSDKIKKTEYQPADDNVDRNKIKPPRDQIAKTEIQPAGDTIGQTEKQPAGDTIVKTENQPASDEFAKNESHPASDKTVRTETQADGSLKTVKIPTARIQSKDTKSGEKSSKNINVVFIESEFQEHTTTIYKGTEKNISPTHSKNSGKTSPKAASIPKGKSLSLQSATTVTGTTASPDDTNRSAVKTPK